MDTSPVSEPIIEQRPECMNRYPHKLSWIWVDGEMTDRAKCSTCGVCFTAAQLAARAGEIGVV